LWISFSGSLFGGISGGNFGVISDTVTGDSSVDDSDYDSDSNSDGNSVDISDCNRLKFNYLCGIDENQAGNNSGDVNSNALKAL
jgi:hypothetical protein